MRYVIPSIILVSKPEKPSRVASERGSFVGPRIAYVVPEITVCEPGNEGVVATPATPNCESGTVVGFEIIRYSLPEIIVVVPSSE